MPQSRSHGFVTSEDDIAPREETARCLLTECPLSRSDGRHAVAFWTMLGGSEEPTSSQRGWKSDGVDKPV